MLSRRRFAVGLSAVGIASAFFARRVLALQAEAPIADMPPDFDDAALKQIFVDNSEPLDSEYVVKGLGDWPLWWEQQPLETAHWPTDADTIDYAHLPERDRGRSFPLDDTALRRVIVGHAFSRLVTDHSLILFGIRGARRADDQISQPVFENEIELVETQPDHFDYKCLLGVWDTRQKKVWATMASTIPHVAYLYAQREASTFTNEANMMPTGLYRYRIGTHRNGTSSFQPGAFRPDSKAFAVLRCVEDGPITMSRSQFWDTRPTNHGDNIHAGTYSTRPDRPKFWSAGCQVVPGFYSDHNTVPQGDWARFRIAAGLTRTPAITRREEIAPGRFNIETSEDGRKYSYILTTGRDILLASENQAVPTLRFGSSGPKVKALQAALGAPASDQDGIFGLGVQKLLLGSGQTNTPIVDGKVADALRFAL